VAGDSFKLSVLNSADPKKPSFYFHVNADPVSDTRKRHFYLDEKVLFAIACPDPQARRMP
jgi:hypothetical protein